MITYTKENGCHYAHEATGKQYFLYEAMTYKGRTTSDRIVIWDEDEDKFVNFVYGANSIGMAELDSMVSAYVEEYEAKRSKSEAVRPHITYKLTRMGVKLWAEDVVDDILDRDITGDYIITHAHRSIRIPDLAEIHEQLSLFLEEAEKIANEEGI
jgi:hypothetical protein